VRSANGTDAWLALMARHTDRTADSFGSLEAPILGLASDGNAAWVISYAALAAQSWAHVVGLNEALRLVTSIADSIRSGLGVQESLRKTVGERQTTLLLGPPWSSDLAVASVGSNRLELHGERSQWEGDGWALIHAHLDAIQRFEDDSTRVQRIPASVGGETPFVIFDAWPSFERSPQDNVWRGSGNDKDGERARPSR
jgi:hypothetical protein